MSKNTFDVSGNTIFITRPEWDFVAEATVRDDYLEEIQSVSWGLKNERYLHCSKFGYLHSYIMKKWYGEDICKEMTKSKYVIDHMDNVSTNCCINNLCFLMDDYNKAKGLTLDKYNKDKSLIALTMFKDFDANQDKNIFQITIKFNYPATLQLDGFEYSAVIEHAYLLYECDYRKLIGEALNILNDYKEDYTFRPEQLRAIDYHIEGCIGKTLPVDVYQEYLDGNHGHTVFHFERLAPIKGWTKNEKKNFFVISDVKNGHTYSIKL